MDDTTIKGELHPVGDDLHYAIKHPGVFAKNLMGTIHLSRGSRNSRRVICWNKDGRLFQFHEDDDTIAIQRATKRLLNLIERGDL